MKGFAVRTVSLAVFLLTLLTVGGVFATWYYAEISPQAASTTARALDKS